MAFLSPDNRFHFLLITLAGALSTLAFQPFGLWPLLLLSFGLLLHSWSLSTPRQALLNGWWFGLGLQCSGVSWIFWSLHYHGGAPVFMAVLTIFLLACYLAIYTALAGYLVNRLCAATPTPRLVLLYPLSWGLFEWLQGIVLTGFAWMQPGYALLDTPLAGYAALLGSHGVGVLLLVCIGLVLAASKKLLQWQFAAVPVALIVLAGLLLGEVSWTSPRDRAMTVTLVQGNVPQHIKWQREMRLPTLQRYRELTLQSEPSDLVVWPETAVPGYQHRLPGYLAGLRNSMQKRDSDLLLGLFIRDDAGGGYYNSMLSIDGQAYHKRHLVPLGEFIPLRFLVEFFESWVDIPNSDIAHGAEDQPLITIDGVALGVSICFEDAFSRDVRRDLPQAGLLVNVSNDAWFDGSHQTWQHHAIARMRAKETGRYMVRVTNTGVTSIIDAHGRVQALAPVQQVHVLNGTVQPMSGSTPYQRWGDALLVLLACVLLLANRRSSS